MRLAILVTVTIKMYTLFIFYYLDLQGTKDCKFNYLVVKNRYLFCLFFSLVVMHIFLASEIYQMPYYNFCIHSYAGQI